MNYFLINIFTKHYIDMYGVKSVNCKGDIITVNIDDMNRGNTIRK